LLFCYLSFYSNHTSTTVIYTLSLHDALPIYDPAQRSTAIRRTRGRWLCHRPQRQPHQRPDPSPPACARRRHHAIDNRYGSHFARSEEHTSELQSLRHLVCRLLLEKKKKTTKK